MTLVGVFNRSRRFNETLFPVRHFSKINELGKRVALGLCFKYTL